jgi:ribosomal protein L21E
VSNSDNMDLSYEDTQRLTLKVGDTVKVIALSDRFHGMIGKIAGLCGMVVEGAFWVDLGDQVKVKHDSPNIPESWMSFDAFELELVS